MNNYCTIYLVRHGETDWNVKKLIQGHADIPLNKKGEEQAKELIEKLTHVKFDTVFTPLGWNGINNVENLFRSY